MPDPRDEFDQLCERCGYPIDGLPPDARCPECGRPAAESDPRRRPGSPWQRARSAGAWLRTIAAVLRHPVGFWRDVRIEPARPSFGRANVWVAGALIAAVLAVRVMRERSFSRAAADVSWSSVDTWLVWGAWFLPLAALVAAVLAGLTRIEYWGVRFFGGRRGWRITPTVADCVCGHATVGWLVAAVLWAAVALAIDSGGARRLSLALGVPVPGPSAWLRATAPLAGFFAGLLVFEVLVYFGIRQNRFANRPRPRR